MGFLNKQNKDDDLNFQKIILTKRRTSFELFKYRFSNSEGKNLIICFSSKFQQTLINKSDFVFIDGTFDITPEDFGQVLVMMGRTNHINIPLAYMLLPNKEQKTYELAFYMFKSSSKQNFKPGTTFITDFEPAESNAVKNILMDTTHTFQFCYFHYTQIMKRYFDNYEPFIFLEKLRYIANLFPFISESLLKNVLKIFQNGK